MIRRFANNHMAALDARLLAEWDRMDRELINRWHEHDRIACHHSHRHGQEFCRCCQNIRFEHPNAMTRARPWFNGMYRASTRWTPIRSQRGNR